MLSKRFLLVCVAISCFLTLSQSVYADFSASIKQTVLNKLAKRIGPIAESGHVSFGFDAPCVPKFWKTCHVTVFADDWTATIDNVTFTILPTGITYQGTIFATLGFLPYFAGTASGKADIDILSDNRIRLSFDTLNIPLQWDIPVIGIVTVHTIHRSLNYGFTVPFNSISLPISPPSENRKVRGNIIAVTREYHDAEVRIKGDLIFK